MLEVIIDYTTPFFQSVGLIGALAGAVGALCILSILLYFRLRLNPYRRAVKWYERGHLARAFLLLKIALDKNPSNKPALLMISDIQLERGEYADAERAYYRLLDLKEPGDGIDTFKIKLRLLKPLFRQEKLLAIFKVATEILSDEPSNAEALYHLGLIYLSQLYYSEAYKIFSYLIKSRPRFHEALFACAVTAVQLQESDTALRHIKGALAFEDAPLYRLVFASIHFFRGNWSECLAVLGSISRAEKSFDKREQYAFYLTLEAFSHYLKGDFERATESFKTFYSLFGDSFTKKESVKEDGVIYDEFGRIGKKEGRREADVGQIDKSELQEYFKLKEVSIEIGRRDQWGRRNLSRVNALLDLEGLSEKTWASLNIGFSLVKSGKLKEAAGFFKEVKEQHPEVLGLNKIIGLIDERFQEKTVKGVKSGYYPVERSTEKIISNKKGRYELWEYITAWEKTVIRPYHLLSSCGFTVKKQLSPGVLFKKDGPASWLFK